MDSADTCIHSAGVYVKIISISEVYIDLHNVLLDTDNEEHELISKGYAIGENTETSDVTSQPEGHAAGKLVKWIVSLRKLNYGPFN